MLVPGEGLPTVRAEHHCSLHFQPQRQLGWSECGIGTAESNNAETDGKRTLIVDTDPSARKWEQWATLGASIYEEHEG